MKTPACGPSAERLLRWQAAGRRLEAENIALRKQLNFIPRGAQGFVTARVVADSGRGVRP